MRCYCFKGNTWNLIFLFLFYPTAFSSMSLLIWYMRFEDTYCGCYQWGLLSGKLWRLLFLYPRLPFFLIVKVLKEKMANSNGYWLKLFTYNLFHQYSPIFFNHLSWLPLFLQFKQFELYWCAFFCSHIFIIFECNLDWWLWKQEVEGKCQWFWSWKFSTLVGKQSEKTLFDQKVAFSRVFQQFSLNCFFILSFSILGQDFLADNFLWILGFFFCRTKICLAVA